MVKSASWICSAAGRLRSVAGIINLSPGARNRVPYCVAIRKAKADQASKFFGLSSLPEIACASRAELFGTGFMTDALQPDVNARRQETV
jgi:hypothetical protein